MAACCILASLAAAVPAGCGSVAPSEGGSTPEQVLGYNPGAPGDPTGSQTPGSTTSDPAPSSSGQVASFNPGAPSHHVEGEPNGTWEQAEAVPFGGQVVLSGTLAAGVMDVDLFDIGPGLSGQRLQADLAASGADVQLGVFDAQHRILAYIDPHSPTAGPGRVDVVLPEDTEQVLVMVATRSTASTPRPYEATVSLSLTTLAPAVHPQAVVLVFQGANQVRIGSRPPVNVPVFDIGSINADFSGQTEEAVQLLMQKVREHYAGLNVTFYRDSDPDRPAKAYMSIYFGTSDTQLLGLADSIDPFNGNPTQSAIIYTDTFSLFNQLHPGFDSTVQVLANVASHETGHLLGLRHAADPEELMDVTATARQMLADQYFKTANLHNSVLPFGLQDAPTMLGWSVGGQLAPRPEPKMYARSKSVKVEAGGPDDFYIPRSLLADCGCPQCDRAYVQTAGN